MALLRCGMGWRPDLPDKRDFKYGAKRPDATVAAVAAAARPVRAMIRGMVSQPVFDQGPRSSCTGQSTAVLAATALRVSPRSAAFIYAEARKMIGELSMDNGAYVRDAVKVIATLGAPRDDLWPDTAANLYSDPVEKADKDAAKRVVHKYYGIETTIDAETCITAGYGYVGGSTLYSSFYDAETNGGIVWLPKAADSMIGGHATFRYGYDNEFPDSAYGRHVIAGGGKVPERVRFVRNSWGAKWGMQGNYILEAAYDDDRDLSDDFWTVRKAA